MNVKKVQEELNKKGFGPLAEDGILGPKTTAAVKKFQIAEHLPADGIVGPELLDALIPSVPITAKTISLRAMQIAVSKDGVREATGQNDGPDVEAYLKSVGLPKGYAWCMAFVYWCYNEAAKQLKGKNPLVKTAGCMRQWNETPAFARSKTPIVGDIFIMDLGGGSGHTGIVTAVHADGSFDTVEGNTNTNGSANGDGVYLRKRKQGGKMKGFIRW